MLHQSWQTQSVLTKELYKILSFVKKKVDRFWESVDAILEDVSVTEKINWC